MSRVWNLLRPRFVLLLATTAIPSFFIGCQEASIDLQRSLIQALAFRLGDVLFATTTV
jgi:hypothetical protein